jgi:glycosyltransferase involved in cell wall biosynthesis
METSAKPNISFFCPAYNDEENIEQVVSEAAQLLEEISNQYEIIVVEDGSPDRTAQVTDALAQKYKNITVVHHPVNLGYGAALKDGFSRCRYEWVTYTDGDHQFNIQELKKMLPLLKDADMVTGYRTNRVISIKRLIQSWIFNWIIRTLFKIETKDVNCALKIFKKKALDSILIDSDSSFITAEILIKLRDRGYKIAQVGVTHYPRLHGIASGAKFKVVFSTVKDIFRYYFLLNKKDAFQ